MKINAQTNRERENFQEYKIEQLWQSPKPQTNGSKKHESLPSIPIHNMSILHPLGH